MSCSLRTAFLYLWSLYVVIIACPCAGSKFFDAFESSILGKDVTQNQARADSTATLSQEEHPSNTKDFYPAVHRPKSGSIYAERNENHIIDSYFRPLKIAKPGVLLEPVDVAENYNSTKTDVTAILSRPNSLADTFYARQQNSEEILKTDGGNPVAAFAKLKVDSNEPAERQEFPRELFETGDKPLFTNASRLEPKESADDSDFDSSQYEAAYILVGDDYGDDVEVVDQLLVRPSDPRSNRKKPDLLPRKRNFRGPKPRSSTKSTPGRKGDNNVRSEKHNGSNNSKQRTYRNYDAGKTKFANQTNLQRRKGVIEELGGGEGDGRRIGRGTAGRITNKDRYRSSKANTAIVSDVPDDRFLTESRVPDHPIDVQVRDQSFGDHTKKIRTNRARAPASIMDYSRSMHRMV